MPRSRYIPKDEKLASLLVRYLPKDLQAKFYKERIKSSVIISMFEWHHFPYKFEDGGPNEWWNIDPVEPDKHKIETAKQAKAKAKQNRLTGKAKKRAGKKIPGRKLPGKGQGRKLQSRSSLS